MGDGLRSAPLPMAENHSLLLSNKFVRKSNPPWKLLGEGIILIYKFKKEWVEKQGNLPKHLAGKFAGGLGLVLLANYKDTPVGPFHEVLFIPGKFRKTKKQAITKVITDTEVSTQNGHVNWGLPKETMPIEWETSSAYDKVRITKSGKSIFAAEFETIGLSFPVSTAFFPLRLCQTWNKLKYYIRLSGSGWGRFAKIKSLDLDPNFFPDIRDLSPILVMKINPLRIQFPEPTYKDEVP